MWRGFYYYRRVLNRRALLRTLALILIVSLLTLALTATARMRPLLESLATTRVSNTVTRIVTEAVDEAVQSGDIRYENLTTLEKDNEGKITALYSNMAAFNRLQANILDVIPVSYTHLTLPTIA